MSAQLRININEIVEASNSLQKLSIDMQIKLFQLKKIEKVLSGMKSNRVEMNLELLVDEIRLFHKNIAMLSYISQDLKQMVDDF